jgi:hypothetical protein
VPKVAPQELPSPPPYDPEAMEALRQRYQDPYAHVVAAADVAARLATTMVAARDGGPVRDLTAAIASTRAVGAGARVSLSRARNAYKGGTRPTEPAAEGSETHDPDGG